MIYASSNQFTFRAAYLQVIYSLFETLYTS